jgi:hypothetical protein
MGDETMIFPRRNMDEIEVYEEENGLLDKVFVVAPRGDEIQIQIDDKYTLEVYGNLLRLKRKY